MPSKPQTIMRTVTAGRQKARPRRHSPRFSPITSLEPATSTQTSRICRVGFACSSAAAASRGAPSSRRIISPLRARLMSYALGWYIYATPNGDIVWHDGDALSFGSFVGLAPDRNVGVVILSNETNVGFPAALGQ